MKKYIFGWLSICVVVLFTACGTSTQESGTVEVVNEQPDNTPLGQASVVDDVSAANILHVAMGSPDHTTLVAAVQAAKIEHVLANAGPLTVFAPNNAAFEKLPAGTVENLVKPENKATLTTILTRHAAPGSYDIDALKKEARKGRKLYMATGDYLEVKVEGDDVFVGGAKVIGTISTSNGIINVVESVILPKE